jgi:hypothetical protein
MIKDILINYEEIIAKKGVSPIWFVNLEGEIKAIRGKKVEKIFAEKIVVKGDLDQIKRHPATKKRLLKAHFSESSNALKKVNEFDLNRVQITKVEFLKSLGYGLEI